MAMTVVVNPVAGHNRGQRAGEAVSRLLAQRGIPHTCVYTEHPGHATELARAAVAGGASVVASVGGDGTLHEVVNGLVGGRATLGVVSCGTGNDFARTLGLPVDPLHALEVVLSGVRRRLDLGRVNDRYFINVAGVGFDAEACVRVNRYSKRITGKLPYLAAVLATLASYRCAPAELVIDGVPMQADVFLVSVGNGKYYGSAMMMCPGAEMDDGLLDVVVGDGVGRLEALRLLPKVYSGTHVSHRKVKVYRAKEISVRPQSPLSVQADGEVIGRTPAVFSVAPGALDVLCPR
ncbi:MAG: diacylglycerol kinase family protein [Bacillota bacterium]